MRTVVCETKQCTKCLSVKTLEHFTKRGDYPDRYRSQCKECTRSSNNNRYHTKYAGPSHRKRGYKHVLKNKYGLTPQEFSSLLESQESECLICSSKLEDMFKHTEGKRAVVDHCHDTGKVRGILCGTCNTGIGNLQDSTKLLEKAIEYLKNSSS